MKYILKSSIKTLLKNNRHHNEHLQNAYNTYGYDNFKFYIIEKCEVDLKSYLEKNKQT